MHRIIALLAGVVFVLGVASCGDEMAPTEGYGTVQVALSTTSCSYEADQLPAAISSLTVHFEDGPVAAFSHTFNRAALDAACASAHAETGGMLAPIEIASGEWHTYAEALNANGAVVNDVSAEGNGQDITVVAYGTTNVTYNIVPRFVPSFLQADFAVSGAAANWEALEEDEP
jgi:hypothetical protein